MPAPASPGWGTRAHKHEADVAQLCPAAPLAITKKYNETFDLLRKYVLDFGFP